ncbi:MAG: Cna B-type domain-containing protein [Clostridia bacterium]|nr:Cna B-type domain-containing protein [Clostridia bacterium]
MKKMISVLGIFIILTVVAFNSVITVCAINPVETDRASSLTLKYSHNGKNYDNIEISTYRIADVEENGVFTLTERFKDYYINIYDITSQAEWEKITQTAASYISADKLLPDAKAVTDEEGVVKFSGIKPGMYLTMSVRVENNGEITIFEDFITLIPQTDGKGVHNYDVSAFPKCRSYVPAPEKIEYKVVKQWKDNGFSDKRPESIEIEIIRNGNVVSVQKLAADNNWSYKWTAPDDGSRWQAVERNVPEGYTVSMVESGRTIIITNSYTEQSVTPPQTGDISVTWPYVVTMCISGGLIILLAIWSKRTEK